MEKIKAIQAIVQEAIDNGATTVEQVHRMIAAKPFDYLDKIGPLTGKLDKAKGATDMSIGMLYETIRNLNEKVGEVAKTMLDKAGSR